MFDSGLPIDELAPQPLPDAGSGPVSGGIPTGLDDIEPGPALAALLSTLDVSTLEGHDRLIVLRAHQRMVSHHQAMLYRSMCSVWDATEEVLGGDVMEVGPSAAAEVRIALGLTRRSADRELSLARDLSTRIPAVADALHRGTIDVRRAQVFDRETVDLPERVARAIVARVVGDAGSLTTGELRARLQRLRMEADPEDAARRHERSHTERRVVVEPSPDGTAHLHAYDLPADHATAIMRRLTAAAKSLKRGGESRTTDQLRADVLVESLVGSDGSAGHTVRTADVTLHVDLATLAQMSDRPGELAGYGPVVADIARRVAAESPGGRWTYVVSGASGRIESAGITRRRPSAALRRVLLATADRCVFPGCRMPSVECDIDHTQAWAEGGPTAVSNLAPLCRHDHRVKGIDGWGYQRSADGGVEWQTPLGQTRRVVAARSP